MTSGFHSHYCPRCKKQKVCVFITHCQKDPTVLCADCAYDDYVEECKYRQSKKDSEK